MNHLILAEILGPDLIVIVVIVMVLFGGSQVPKLARSIGTAKREFEKGISGVEGEPATEAPQVTMTKAELEALLAEREKAARENQPPAAPPA
ncbi:MAG: hypothetical protein QOG64_393 [Acidimicrobiaceae bacterium]|nr:hypothetical protein [Acidimicrobiaceae bacterium]